MSDNGMIAATDGRHAVCIDKANGHYGWVFYKHPDGMWVSHRKASEGELNQATAVAAQASRIAKALGFTGEHPDDDAVDRFAAAMKAKLAKARAKGYGGWDDPDRCTVELLSKQLVAHLGKCNAGTFEDVANFAMMLHQRGADPKVLAGAAVEPIQRAVSEAHALGVAALESAKAKADPVAEAVAFVQVTGSPDEIDAPVWPFINAEAQKVGAEKGRIETYKYERANGGVAVLWDANRIHAMAVTIRDDMNRTRCIRILTTHPHDAELVELLRQCRGIVAKEVERWTRVAAILPVNANVESGLLNRIDTYLSTLPRT
jgi:hypothetical protein